MDFLKLASKKRDEAISLLEKLVSFPSILDEFNPDSDAPFGKANKDVLNFFLEEAKQAGFKVKNIDNYAGHVEYTGTNSETLGILAHLDVVPVAGQNWKTDPFKLTILDGCAYGRGTADDKGPLVAAYLALKILKEENIKLNKNIRIIVGSDEESGSRCLEHYFKYEPMPEFGFSPDAEFPVIYGEKSIASFDVYLKENEGIITDFICGTRYNVVPGEAKLKLSINLEMEYQEFLEKNNYQGTIENGYLVAYGRSCHAMCPQNGLNAAFILMEFLNSVKPTRISEYFVKYLTNDPFGKKLGINIYHEDLKDLTENIGIVNYEDGYIKIGLNYRIPVNDYGKIIMLAFEKTFTSDDRIELLSESPIHFVPKDSELVKTLLNAYREITNDYENEPFTIGGGTYAKFIKNCVAFGPQIPGSDDVCHIADEYIKIDDLVQSIAIYLKAIYDLGV